MDKFDKEIEMAKPDENLDGQFVNRVMSNIEPAPTNKRRWAVILPISIGSSVAIVLAGFLVIGAIWPSKPTSNQTANIVASTPTQVIEALDTQTIEVVDELEKDINSDLDTTQFDDIVY